MYTYIYILVYVCVIICSIFLCYIYYIVALAILFGIQERCIRGTTQRSAPFRPSKMRAMVGAKRDPRHKAGRLQPRGILLI